MIVLVGILLCFLPGLYAAAAFAFLPAVVAFERGEVIGRCFRLLHADLGASLSRVLTVGGIYLGAGVVSSIIGRLIRVIEYSTDNTAVGIVSALTELAVTGVFSAVVTILTIPLLVGAYADMRARLDGDVHAGRLAAELAS